MEGNNPGFTRCTMISPTLTFPTNHLLQKWSRLAHWVSIPHFHMHTQLCTHPQTDLNFLKLAFYYKTCSLTCSFLFYNGVWISFHSILYVFLYCILSHYIFILHECILFNNSASGHFAICIYSVVKKLVHVALYI